MSGLGHILSKNILFIKLSGVVTSKSIITKKANCALFLISAFQCKTFNLLLADLKIFRPFFYKLRSYISLLDTQEQVGKVSEFKNEY